MVFKVVRAPDHPDLKSTTQYNYDHNGNLVETLEGIEEVPHVTTRRFDGYNRLWSPDGDAVVDPMENALDLHYDANGNLVQEFLYAELVDVEGGEDNVRLSETAYRFDWMDRETRRTVEFFDPGTQEPLDDGKSITRTEYTDNSQVSLVEDDRGNQTTFTYDTVNRVDMITDAKGNIARYETRDGQSGYDANSNVISIKEIEKSDLDADEVVFTEFSYDPLNRRLSTTDNVGNVNQVFYDSRDNQVRTVDAEGNETVYIFDGVGRLLQTVRDMNGNAASTFLWSQSIRPRSIYPTQRLWVTTFHAGC